MRSLLAAFGKSALFASFVLVLTVPSFSQVGLRNAVDTDADGRADFTIFRPSTNQWFTAKSTGGIRVQEFGVFNTDFMVPGDYDGDDLGDIAVWRETTGTWYYLTSANNTFNARAWGIPGDEPVARDYDGDGATDLAVVRRTNGNMIWYMYLSATNGFEARQFGLATDFTAPGDYNGDGKYDTAVQRPGASAGAAATFYINTTATFETYTFGLTNDLVVPGDYDGDGKTDIAVVREGALPTDSLQWFIRQSSNGQTVQRTWGVSGTDLNVQNDYDGDNKTDVAIWRNADGKFYIVSSLTGGITVVSWGVSNDFPVASYDTH